MEHKREGKKTAKNQERVKLSIYTSYGVCMGVKSEKRKVK